MTKVDQFESVFRAAAKTLFEYEPLKVTSVLVVADQTPQAAEAFGKRVASFLTVLERGESVRWVTVSGEDFSNVPELLDLVERERPGLICTYRHLHSQSVRWPYTLGEFVDVLTQVTTTPVLILPHPESPAQTEPQSPGTATVMAVTDHLTGDHRLVNFAVRFTETAGQLYLTHVEDDSTLDRFVEAIGRIPSIDTDDAELRIRERLLRDPTDYIESCVVALAAANVEVSIQRIVTLGHRLREYKRLVEEHGVDLLVFNTKDDDQLAMHGLAYPLAIELRDTPLLML